jgi:hypothetical protein
LALGKFGPDGEPDTTFGVGGVSFGAFTMDWSQTNEGSLGASVMPDGRILVSGMGASPNAGFLMVRLTPEGTADSTYGTDGISLVAEASYLSTGRHYLRPDGSTLQFGGSSGLVQGLCLARDANGTVIPSFGSNGVATASTGTNYQYFIGGFQPSDGSIIGYGYYYGSQQMLVARLRDTPHPLPEITLTGGDLTTTGVGPFQWQLDGIDIPGATGNTWTPTGTGNYTVVMTLSPGCIFTSSPFSVTGIAEHVLHGLAVMGNPVEDILQVRSPAGEVAFDLADAAGRKLVDGRLHTGINRIDMHGAEAGIYFLHVTKAGERRVERIVVM